MNQSERTCEKNRISAIWLPPLRTIETYRSFPWTQWKTMDESVFSKCFVISRSVKQRSAPPHSIIASFKPGNPRLFNASIRISYKTSIRIEKSQHGWHGSLRERQPLFADVFHNARPWLHINAHASFFGTAAASSDNVACCNVKRCFKPKSFHPFLTLDIVAFHIGSYRIEDPTPIQFLVEWCVRRLFWAVSRTRGAQFWRNDKCASFPQPGESCSQSSY